MFQTFDTPSDPSTGPERVARLREVLSERDLDGFLVPRADEHQGEYVAAASERLRWLTGFSGSAGVALILRERAVLWVDGRYTLQAANETDGGVFTVESLIEEPPAAWIKANLGRGARIGFDPWLHTIHEMKALREAGESAGVTFVALEGNPVDALWADRPAPPAAPVSIQPEALAGELAKDKLARLAQAVQQAGATHFVLTDPSSVAWAFNIRGGDVPHTPLVLAFAVLAAEGLPTLFLDEKRLSIEPRAYLTQLADMDAPERLRDRLRSLSADGGRIGLDAGLSAEALRVLVEENGGTTVAMSDPARLPRATKNAVEIAGSRAAHRRDGAAMAALLSWLDRQPAGSLDEIKVVTELEAARAKAGEAAQMPLRDVSFPTIAGAGANGAVIHYRVSESSNRRLDEGELFLLDSGAQYADGTTDVTRTVAIGTPTTEMRERFTLVLKGMIALSALRFPPGTRGADIDAFARRALWAAGLDYAHGTGHGVGSFLSVHEGPQRIAKTGTQALLTGMILSNEPGYYKPGAYGIRIENLILVEEPGAVEGGDKAMHGFETLTLVPIDRRLVVTGMLERWEVAWLDAYHARVLAEIGPLADGNTLAWLMEATAPLTP